MSRDESVSSVLAKLESELVEIEQKRAEIDQRRTEVMATVSVLRKAIGMEPLKIVHPPHESPPKTHHVQADVSGSDRPYLGLNVLDAIKAYLRKVREPKTPPEIADALHRGGLHSRSSDFVGVVRTTMSRNGASAGIEAFGKGTWGLSEWRPGGAKGE
jgi:hypothetical protein